MESPTPEQIAKRAAKIRDGWDEEQTRKRAGAPEFPYEIPTVGVAVTIRKKESE